VTEGDDNDIVVDEAAVCAACRRAQNSFAFLTIASLQIFVRVSSRQMYITGVEYCMSLFSS